MAKSVLVVDDDQAFRDVVSDLLRSRGFEVSGLAATSDEAVHAVRLLRPDGVLLDVTLASMDDFELVQELQFSAGVSVLLTSSDPDSMNDSVAREVGAIGFIPKIELARIDLHEYFERWISSAGGLRRSNH
jgi:chemotaxis response regulator CheB